MKVLAMNSSGDKTSISVILDDEINSFTMSHERKERPNWDMFLDYVGHNQTFTLKEIDLFAFGNNQNSYTATRTIASYLKGLAIALEKPLISIDCASGNDIEADDIAMTAKEKYIKADYKKDLFDPAEANPSYKEDLKFKKIHEWPDFKFFSRLDSRIDRIFAYIKLSTFTFTIFIIWIKRLGFALWHRRSCRDPSCGNIFF